MLRGSLERGLIFDKEKVFFAKKPEPIRSGLQVDFKIIGGVFAKYTERSSGARVDFQKIEGLFCKKTLVRPIWAVHRPDQTAVKSGRRGHAGRPTFGARIVLNRFRLTM
jgi:hypothetical protein